MNWLNVFVIVLCVIFQLLGSSRNTAAADYSEDDDDLKIIIIGDYGYPLAPAQARVATAMAKWADDAKPDWILSTGDNFYPSGIRSTTDIQINHNWRNMYSQESLRDLNWYISLGNHDYGSWEGDELNELELAKVEPRWILPHHWYDFVEERNGFTVHFIVIDTEAYHWGIDRNNYTAMMTWFVRVLQESTADWKFVIGHRHIFSAGEHGPVTNSLYNYFVPYMEMFDVDAYICGHDHNLQHMKLRTGHQMDYILSGAGGAGLYQYRQANADFILQNFDIETVHFSFRFGFTTMKATRDSVTFDFYNSENVHLYAYTRYK